jgi:serine/threonine protein phosphatase 1
MDTAPASDEHDEVQWSRKGGTRLTCAIGDVHGHIDKLEALLDHCARFCAGHALRLVFVGDYVDRGPDSCAVVALLRELTVRAVDEVICLRGNHEELVVGAATQRLGDLPGRPSLADWLERNGGGAATLASYGVTNARDLPPEHLAWLGTRPASFDDGRRFFVHAGVRPGCPLRDQAQQDMVWIREPFLSHTGAFERLIVHGHTPVAGRRPDLRSNRLNMDSGAGYDGPLSAAVFDDASRGPIAFLNDRGEMRELGTRVEGRHQ